jgi:hypothetical protein
VPGRSYRSELENASGVEQSQLLQTSYPRESKRLPLSREAIALHDVHLATMTDA